ncbi:Thioredoxin domain-containing protein 17 [Cryptotermes secundus]|uniref:Thioredoxin domain-containing protein 17 n=1 Tax=Cryptotermes secundus TaxID=105785 RepID=A0A2J7PD52_9NEOP|nr:thioredoxin domain-containing protein 17 [Cryptotermes secundus]PNF14252.1 Thioredoxin domain-containing protein 17 [Cryptotermes secundus]
MAVRSAVEGYDAFCNLIGELETQGKPVVVYFSGSKGEDGKSWCSDCVKAMPVVEKAVEDAEDIHFVYVGVGDRKFWKDPKCPFRTDKRLRLKSVPTLMVWGQSEKVEEAECSNPDLVSMLFEQP